MDRRTWLQAMAGGVVLPTVHGSLGPLLPVPSICSLPPPDTGLEFIPPRTWYHFGKGFR